MFLIINLKFNKKLDPNHWVKKIQNEQFNLELIKYKHALNFKKKFPIATMDEQKSGWTTHGAKEPWCKRASCTNK
jgi:hypothetical protein